MKKSTLRGKKPIRDVIQSVIKRSPGAWIEFIQRSAPEAAYLIDRILRGRGVVIAPQAREEVVVALFQTLCEEDFKLLRGLPAGADCFRWLAILARNACRTHVSGRRKQPPPGAPRTMREPSPVRLTQVLEEISGAHRRRMASHFDGDRQAPSKLLRSILAETRAKIVDLLVAGAEPSTCISFERLSAFADGVAGPKISSHLDECGKCVQELERIASADRLLRDVLIPRPTGPKLEVTIETLGKIRELVQERKPRRQAPVRKIWGR